MRLLGQKVILNPMRMAHRKSLLPLLALSPLLAGCAQSEVSGLGFEEGITSVNDQSLSLWQGAWITAGVVGVITIFLPLASSRIETEPAFSATSNSGVIFKIFDSR